MIGDQFAASLVIAATWLALRGDRRRDTFSSWKGLFYYSPWLCFYFLGVAFVWRENKAWAAYLVLAPVSYLGFMLLNNEPGTHYWWSGGDFGARKFVPAVPILAMGAAIGMSRSLAACRDRALRRLVTVLFVCAVGFGVFSSSLGALTSPVTYEHEPDDQ